MAHRRTRPRLFSFPHDVELGHFSDLLSKQPAIRSTIEPAIDAFIRICKTHNASTQDLAAVKRAAVHPEPQLHAIGIMRLTVLCHYFEEAFNQFKEVLMCEDENVRMMAATTIANIPEKYGIPLIELALDDKSWRVRKAACQAVCAVNWPKLKPTLDAHLMNEPDSRVKVALRHARALSPNEP